MEMKDIKAVENWLIEKCHHRRKYDGSTDKYYCQLKNSRKCGILPECYFAEMCKECPDDCPKYTDITCTGNKCKFIKKQIQELKMIIQ